MRYTVGLRDANQRLAKHIKAVESGDEVIITRRGKPVARLTADLGVEQAAKPKEDRSKDPKWQAAYARMLRLMGEGLPLGGVRWTRDELYERGSPSDR